MQRLKRRHALQRMWRASGALLTMLFAAQPAVTHAADVAAIDRLAQSVLKQWHQPGFALALVEKGSVTLTRGYGLRDVAARAPVTQDTIFGIGSCSKAFGAADIAKLVDQRRLGWDHRVDKYLPWFRTSDPWVTHEVRVRDLLAHRTGLQASIPRISAPDKLTYLRSIAVAEPLHPFRAQFSYTNDMFTLAGELVAEVTGGSWEDFTRTQFWKPLGMSRTNADHRIARKDGDSATPYVMRADEVVAVPWVYEDHIALPSGGLNSTAADMARWLRFQLTAEDPEGRALITRHSLDEMHTPHTPLRGEFVDPSRRAWGDVVGRGPDGVRSESYGLGWFIHDYQGHEVLAHPGSIRGFRCFASLLPERGFGVVVLLNSENSMLALALVQTLIDMELKVQPRDWSSLFQARQKQMRLERKAASAALDASRIANAPPSRPLAEYTGRFERENLESAIEVTLVAGKLHVALDRAEYEASPWQYDIFRLVPLRLRTQDGLIEWPDDVDDSRVFVTFRIDPAGKLVRLDTPFGAFRRAQAGTK